MLAAITLCAALSVSGCGAGSGAKHGNHSIEASAGSTGEHAGHGAPTDAVSSDSHSAHNGHGSNSEHGTDNVSWTFDPQHPAAGKPFNIDISMKGSEGQPIEQFDISHEKLLHLIVVSEDLSRFYHLHPDYDGKSGFHQEIELPKGGTYRLFADYKPAGEAAVTAQGTVHLEGEERNEPLTPDSDTTKPKKVDSMKVALDISTLKAGEESKLTFRFEDDATGAKVSDLETYLGAIGHVVIIGEGAETYLHVHAENDNDSGPDATFAAQFPKPGLYRIWGQFQRNGTVSTVSYTVKAE